MTDHWFVSDTHFCHTNIIKYCDRPFKDVDKMNEGLIQNWNKCVKPNDIIFHLGDFMFGTRRLADIGARLNGRKHLIIGNHDEGNIKKLQKSELFIWIRHYSCLKIGNLRIILCHYPFARWDRAHHGAYCLHGHCHGDYQPTKGKILDVGIDNHPEFRPWHLDEVNRFMAKRRNIGHHERE